MLPSAKTLPGTNATKMSTRPGASRLVAARQRVTCVPATVQADAVSEARQQQLPLLSQLPPSLRNNVAVLEAPNANAPGGKTMVYVLGMSHVSKASCDQVRELVRLVRPEVVAVELCRQRTGLLVDAEAPLETAPVWHTRKVMIEGVPTEGPWPSVEQLKGLLVCKPGKPVTSRNIEGDVVTLLATGLFRAVRPLCETPGVSDAPSFTTTFAADGTPELQTAAPLGSIRFGVQQRILPPIMQMTARLDSSLRSAGVSPEALAAVCSATATASQAAATAATTAATERMAADKAAGTKGEELEAANMERLKELEGGVNALQHYLRAREQLAALFADAGLAGGVQVAFTGVEFGKAEAVVKAARPTDPAYVSGLESSAINGEGQGITPFRPNRPMFKVSERMFVPTDIVDRLRAQQREALEGPAGASAAAVARSGDNGTTCRSEFRAWSEEEAATEEPLVPANAASDTIWRLMMATYSKYQAVAALKVGLSGGAAWRAALEAAAEVGTQQVLLADRPTNVTERKLADAVFASAGVRMLGVVGLVGGSIAATAGTDLSTELGAVAAALAASTALLWAFIGPFLEIQKFSSLSASEIEAAVAMDAPFQGGDASRSVKVFGEDALLNWPGAMEPLIADRDAYLARTMAAAAKGVPSAAPAYILDRLAASSSSSSSGADTGDASTASSSSSSSASGASGLLWRYMAPDDAAVPPLAAPRGSGDGAYRPLPGPRAIVGVVGTAHVPGICAEWQKALEDSSVEPLLRV